MTEFAVRCLRRNRLPHIPRFALAVFNAGQVGRVGLVSVAGGVGAAAVGDEYEVVLNQVNRMGFSVLGIHDLPGDHLIAFVRNHDVLYVHAVFNLHAVAF